MTPIPTRPRAATPTAPPAGYELISSLPYTITKHGGKYAMSKDIVASATNGFRNGLLKVSANDVSIKGCGHLGKWSGVATDQEPRFLTMGSAFKGLVVEDLNVEWNGAGLKDAIIVQGGATFRNVHIKSNVGGYYFEKKTDSNFAGSRVERCSVTLSQKAVKLLVVQGAAGVIVEDCDFEVIDAAVTDSKSMSYSDCHGMRFERNTLTVRNAGGPSVGDNFEPLKIYDCNDAVFRGCEFRAYSRAEGGQAGFLSIRDTSARCLFEGNYVYSDYKALNPSGAGGHIIRGNVIIGGKKARTPNEGYAIIIASQTEGTVFRDNLILGFNDRAFLFRGWGGHALEGNTIVSYDGPAVDVYDQQSGELTFKRNIFVSMNDSAVVKRPASTARLLMDYDCLHRPVGAVITESNVASTLAAFSARTGQETHGIERDPMFVGALTAMSTKPEDYALRDGSPAIGKGWTGTVDEPPPDPDPTDPNLAELLRIAAVKTDETAAAIAAARAALG